MKLRIKERLGNYKRVLIVARKPTKEEYILTAKVCALGVIIVGLIGFIFYVLAALFVGG